VHRVAELLVLEYVLTQMPLYFNFPGLAALVVPLYIGELAPRYCQDFKCRACLFFVLLLLLLLLFVRHLISETFFYVL